MYNVYSTGSIDYDRYCTSYNILYTYLYVIVLYIVATMDILNNNLIIH